jgi:IstB-like ATP binding protein
MYCLKTSRGLNSYFGHKSKRFEPPVFPSDRHIGNPASADGILDRLAHHGHRVEMHGESVRKKRSPRLEKVV